MPREPHEFAKYPDGHPVKTTCLKCGFPRTDYEVHPEERDREPDGPVLPEAVRRMRASLDAVPGDEPEVLVIDRRSTPR